MFIKFVLTLQLLKSPHLLMESGDVVNKSWLHVLYLMLNLQEEQNELESVTDSFIMFIKLYATQQLLKSADLLRESGEIVVDS